MVNKALIEKLGNADATNEGDASAVARLALGCLTGYRVNTNSKFKERDIKVLADILQAYAYMLQEEGIKVVLDN